MQSFCEIDIPSLFGPRSGPAMQSLRPTPSHDAHEEINSYIRRLAHRGFPITPRPRNGNPQDTPHPERLCTALLRYIYFQTNKDSSQRTLVENALKQAERLDPDQRTLENLQEVLKDCKKKLENEVALRLRTLHDAVEGGSTPPMSRILEDELRQSECQ